MADGSIPEEACPEVPEGAAVFPLIPEELGIHPLLLATLHAIVFLDGSDENIMNDAAAAEALDGIATYLQALARPRSQPHPRGHGLPARVRQASGMAQRGDAVLPGFLKRLRRQAGLGERPLASA